MAANPKERDRIFTISNMFSFARLVLVWPIVYYLYQQTPRANWLAFAFMMMAVATDYLDGYLARKLNQKSDLGRIIDPLADKVGLGIVMLVLTMTHDLPLWFFILIISRDLAILILGFFMVSRANLIPESNWSGKFAVGAFALVIIVYTLSIDFMKSISIAIAVALFLYSIVSYSRRFLGFIQQQGNQQL